MKESDVLTASSESCTPFLTDAIDITDFLASDDLYDKSTHFCRTNRVSSENLRGEAPFYVCWLRNCVRYLGSLQLSPI